MNALSPKRALLSYVIVWFRNDLRIHDNEVLQTALRSSEGRVVPVYVFDKRQVGRSAKTPLGLFSKCSRPRAQFLVESVRDLAESLQRQWQGMQLLTWVESEPERAIPQLILSLRRQHQIEIKAVYCQQEVCKEEKDVEEALERELQAIGSIALHRIWGASSLFHRDDIPYGNQHHQQKRSAMENLLNTFTHFRKRVEDTVAVRRPLNDACVAVPLAFQVDCDPVPEDGASLIGDNCEWIQWHRSVSDSSSLENGLLVDKRSCFPFRGGETAAMERLVSYTFETDALANYKDTRNGLIGTEYSTKLSPYLALGCLSARQIHHHVRQYENQRPEKKGVSTYWVLFELMWRDYFRFMALAHGDALFRVGGVRHVKPSKPWIQDVDRFRKWAIGQTGFPFVDANQRELLHTGWMSNRGRQNVASFLAKDLQIDWRLGAEWFESLLLDYDPHSNYGNWQYCAGVGSDPRENRYFDVFRQAKIYDEHRDYVRMWVPELSGCQDPYNLDEVEAAVCAKGRYPMVMTTPRNRKGHATNALVSKARRREKKHQAPLWMQREHAHDFASGTNQKRITEYLQNESK